MEENNGMRGILIAALILIIVGGTTDLILDRPATWMSFHVLFELMMIVGALVLTTALWLAWRQAGMEAQRLKASLAERKAERDAWMATAQKSLDGLSAAIDAQFQEWHLTPAERDVALLLLKGYSHKHVAAETGRSERTVRQHATTVYQKAGLGSRAELAAFFLDALRLPVAAGH
jgi:DNA-binding CsgD family transcriptional regulator